MLVQAELRILAKHEQKGMVVNMIYVLEQDCKEYELMGGKATALSQLGRVIDNIPEWFVISYKGFDIDNKNIKKEAEKEIVEALKKFPNNTYFAVRSSAGNEDSKDNSLITLMRTSFLVPSFENLLVISYSAMFFLSLLNNFWYYMVF